jgi:hypothetical protein
MGYVIGIDPGINGGVALLDWDGSRTRIEAFPMPTVFMLTSMKDRLQLADSAVEPEKEAPTRKRGKRRKKKTSTGKKHLVDVEALQARVQNFPVLLSECLAVVIERPLPRPLEGLNSTLTSGTMFGQLLGLFTAHHIHPCLPLPTQWKDVVLAGTEKDKAAAIAFSRKHFPDLSLLPSSRHRTPHDGMADAVCIAEYARRLVEEHRGQLRHAPAPGGKPARAATTERGRARGRGRRSGPQAAG